MPGSITQNSLPSGSASTTWPSSGRCPMSMWRAPSSTSVATDSRWSSRDVLVRSRWSRFGPTFGSGTGTKSIPNLVPSVGTRRILFTVSSATSQRSASAQNRARPSGSFASTQSATSRRDIPLPSIAAPGGDDLPSAFFSTPSVARRRPAPRPRSVRSRPGPSARVRLRRRRRRRRPRAAPGGPPRRRCRAAGRRQAGSCGS